LHSRTGTTSGKEWDTNLTNSWSSNMLWQRQLHYLPTVCHRHTGDASNCKHALGQSAIMLSAHKMPLARQTFNTCSHNNCQQVGPRYCMQRTHSLMQSGCPNTVIHSGPSSTPLHNADPPNQTQPLFAHNKAPQSYATAVPLHAC
jgi:hypothetical protein